MSGLTAKFEELRAKGEKALVLFVTGGDPSAEDLPDILEALAEGGADIIEVGLPFSDPIADGPIIQASSQRALDRGVTHRQILDAVQGFNAVPVVMMGYYNTVLRTGEPEFANLLVQSGLSGSIVSDLTPEEADSWIESSKRVGLDNIFLAAPTSTEARLQLVAEKSSGFVYAVSRTGVTGSAEVVPPEVVNMVERIKRSTDMPVCVGFGISQPDHVRMVCQAADGAVVGSWLVDKLANSWNSGQGRTEIVESIRALKAATR